MRPLRIRSAEALTGSRVGWDLNLKVLAPAGVSLRSSKTGFSRKSCIIFNMPITNGFTFEFSSVTY